MIKKLSLTISAALIILLNLSCYENDQEATITVDFGSVEALEEATGITGISKAAEVIPPAVNSIEIRVYSGDEVKGVLYRKVFYRRDFAKDNVTISVPAGKSRIVKAIARHMDGTILYTGTSTPVNLVSGVDITVPVTMEYYPDPLGPTRDAQFNLIIQAPSYPAGLVSSIVVRIYRPSVNANNYLELGNRDTDSTYGSGTTNVNGLLAYPHTYQMIMVMAMAPDNTIAAIGGTVISTLVSGTGNPDVNVTLLPPAPLMITFNASINQLTFAVQMYYGATWYTVNVASSQRISGNIAILSVPNRVNNVKEWEDPAAHGSNYNTIARDIRFMINSTPYLFTLSASDDCLRWKETYATYNGSYWEWDLDTDPLTLPHTH